MSDLSRLILSNLAYNDVFSRRVAPFLSEEYFESSSDKIVYKIVSTFIKEYNTPPTKDAILICLDKVGELNDDSFNSCKSLVDSLQVDDKTDQEWLVNETENYCKERSIYNAIMESIHIIDGKSNSKTANAIPSILSDALAVSFDAHIGHDYIEDSEARFDFYNQVETKIGFDLDYMNRITGGGTPKKTLNIVMAGTGVGKSLFLCHHAAACLSQNKNVLYITCEMAEERIAERIDANLLDMKIDDIGSLTKDMYMNKLQQISDHVKGKLIIKEYPTASAGATHFRNLLGELWLKKKFKPDIIFIDYLNICNSSRLKNNGTVNSYTFVKAIAEELRGLAIEQNVPIFSATQVNRSGFNNSDMGLEDTSESFGLPQTADLMFALISTEELEERDQIMVKQLKNRYNDPAKNRKFVLGINRGKMKLYDVNLEEQYGIVNSNQTSEEKAGSGYDITFNDKFKKPDLSSWK
jgi:replicative DNA helicase|tara:strand:- start:415 stop:1815 length:1401 start_codon:yes stop_codon:yes gene_type:complete